MDNRQFEAGAAGAPPSPPASPSSGYPTNGNPATATPATKPGEYWFHQLGEEARNVIIAGGLTPNNMVLTQIRDAILQMINTGGIKLPVRAATTANIATLAGGAPSTLDGVSLASGDRILVKDQTTASQNGIYVVTTVGTGANGTWARATDADGAGELLAGMLVVVNEGSTQADTLWELTTDGAITIGTTALTFAQQVTKAASTAEAQAFTVANKAITPATLASAFQGGNQSKTTNGYQKLPGGLILQWGTDNFPAVAGAQNKSSTLPIAFPTAVLFAGGLDNTSGSQSTTAVTYRPDLSNTTQLTFSTGDGINTGLFAYFAIGY